jgi:hypothetical protein
MTQILPGMTFGGSFWPKPVPPGVTLARAKFGAIANAAGIPHDGSPNDKFPHQRREL